MAQVLRVHCSAHNALSGEPCWPPPTMGVCGQRIARVRDAHDDTDIETEPRKVQTRVRSRGERVSPR